MVRDGILVTSPVWTVVALASVLPFAELRSVVRDALGMKLVSIRALSFRSSSASVRSVVAAV